MASKDKTNNTFQVGLIFLSKKNSNVLKLGKTHDSHEVCSKLYANPGLFASLFPHGSQIPSQSHMEVFLLKLFLLLDHGFAL